jgi:peptide/nickel transport system substrate-binding protein
MLDVGCHALFFNIRKAPFDDQKVRQALVMALDRGSIRQNASFFSKEFPQWSMPGMAGTYMESLVSKDALSKMTDYSFSTDKATQLLQSDGWTKNSSGQWQDKNGKTYSFIIGNSSGFTGGPETSCQLSAQQWTAFGFPTQLKMVDGSVFYNQAQGTGGYSGKDFDMACDWGDITWSYSNAYGPLNNDITGGPAMYIGFPQDQNGHYVINLVGTDGTTFDAYTALQKLVYLEPSDPQYQQIVDNITYGYNEAAYGVDLYQNCTDAWYNAGNVTGMVDADQAATYHNIMPIPPMTDMAHFQANRALNLGMCNAPLMLLNGTLKPR